MRELNYQLVEWANRLEYIQFAIDQMEKEPKREFEIRRNPKGQYAIFTYAPPGCASFTKFDEEEIKNVRASLETSE